VSHIFVEDKFLSTQMSLPTTTISSGSATDPPVRDPNFHVGDDPRPKTLIDPKDYHSVVFDLDGVLIDVRDGKAYRLTRPGDDYEWVVVDTAKMIGRDSPLSPFGSGSSWDVPVQGYWRSSGTQPPLPTDSTGHGLDTDEPDWPGYFGWVFQKAGYKYLGPGTDLEYNERNNVEPINALDAAAKVHDYAYKDIEYRYHQGQITRDHALDLVRQADLQLSRVAADWDSAFDGGYAVSFAMGAKVLVQYLLDQASFIDLSKDRAPQEWSSSMGPPPWGSNYVWDGSRWVPPPVHDPTNWQDRYPLPPDPKEGKDPWSGGGPGTPGWNMPPHTYSAHTFSSGRFAALDRNRDGIPDALQRKRKRYHRYRVKRLYYRKKYVRPYQRYVS
jgi:hypothetical protein